MAVNDKDKIGLKNAGVWDEFLRRRDDLKQQGVPPSDATAAALAQFLPRGEEGASTTSESEFRIPPDILEGLSGKNAKPVDVLQWVANNMMGEPDMESCPGMAAFTLLKDCRMSPALRMDFWKSMWTKLIPARAQIGDEDEDGPIDGTLTLELLAKIRAIRDRAEAESNDGEAST